jgi:hypothetical protein
MIVFEEPKPHELWSLKEPTAIAANEIVRVTLTVTAAAPPAPAAGTPVVLYLEVPDAEHLHSQVQVALGLARNWLHDHRSGRHS